MNEETISQEQYLFNQLNFEERKNIIEIMEYVINLQQENNQLKEELERLKQPTIFIDTQDMEERYGEELYKEYLEKENKQLKDRIEKAIEYIEHKKFIREQVILERSYKLDDFEVRELLKILKGEENK